MFLLSVLEHGWAGYHFRVCRLNLLLRRLCSFLIVRIVLSKNMIMVKRSRAKGWQHAKLSGHQNEDLIATLVITNPQVQAELLRCAHKKGKINRVAEGGIHERNIPSILGDTTKSKPDLRLVMEDGTYVNISVKKSMGGQVFLINVDRFVKGFELHYNCTIPNEVKRAFSLYWGSDQDAREILKKYAITHKAYQVKRNRLVAETLNRYDSKLPLALLQWFKDNIVEIFDYCFVRGLAKNPEDWADVIWYKNMLKDERDGDTMLKLDEVRMKIKNNAENIKFGSRMGGSTILLPFGFVQWHQHAMQFHHRLKSIKELI